MGGWRRLPKRLGAATVGYKCHHSCHLPSRRQWLAVGWAPWGGGGFQCIPAPVERSGSAAMGCASGHQLFPLLPLGLELHRRPADGLPSHCCKICGDSEHAHGCARQGGADGRPLREGPKSHGTQQKADVLCHAEQGQGLASGVLVAVVSDVGHRGGTQERSSEGQGHGGQHSEL